jgi:hypothetical protein
MATSDDRQNLLRDPDRQNVGDSLLLRLSSCCRQWLDDMTQEQKFTAAADMLAGAQSTDDNNAGLPEDDLIDSFAGDITQGCEAVATMKITDAAISIYQIGRDQYGP